MHHIAGWWDGFELWVAGLPFIPQFAVVLVGAVPLSFLLAYLLDRGLRAVLHALGRDRDADSGPVDSARGAADADVPGSDAPAAEPEPVLSGAGMRVSGSMREETV